MSDDNGFRAKASRAAETFATWRDTVKVQAHLAGKEAEDLMMEMTEHLSTMADRLDKLAREGGPETDEARLKLHLALMEARDRWDKLRPTYERLVHAARSGGKATAETLGIDRAQVQAHLARMDAEDAIEARAEEARTWLNQAGDKAEDTINAVVDRLKAQADEVFGPLKKD